MSSIRRRRLFVVLVTGGALALGWSGHGSATTAPTTPAAADQPPIILGNVGSYSGPSASNTGGVREGLELWQSYVNDNGGIDGHPVEIKFADDTGDPTVALTEVTRLVDEEHIVAMIDPASSVVGWQQYLSDEGIPSINASGYNFVVPGLSFNVSTSLDVNNQSQVVMAQNTGAESYAFIYCGEIAACEQGREDNQAAAEAAGLEFSSHGVSGSDPDFTAVCLEMKDAEVDVVALDAFPATSVRLVADCARQDFHPQYVTVGVAITPEMSTDPNFDGILVSLVAFPWFQDNTPATQEFQAAVQQYMPDVVDDPAVYNANFSAAWAAGTVFAETVAQATDPTSSAEVINALNTVEKNNFGGLTAPLTFKSPSLPDSPAEYVQPPDNNCFFAIQMHDGTWTAPDGDLTDENLQVCL